MSKQLLPNNLLIVPLLFLSATASTVLNKQAQYRINLIHQLICVNLFLGLIEILVAHLIFIRFEKKWHNVNLVLSENVILDGLQKQLQIPTLNQQLPNRCIVAAANELVVCAVVTVLVTSIKSSYFPQVELL